MRISDWSSDVFSSDLRRLYPASAHPDRRRAFPPDVSVQLNGAARFWTSPSDSVAHGQLGRDQPLDGRRWPRPCPTCQRSDERSVWKECVSPCISRWSTHTSTKTN